MKELDAIPKRNLRKHYYRHTSENFDKSRGVRELAHEANRYVDAYLFNFDSALRKINERELGSVTHPDKLGYSELCAWLEEKLVNKPELHECPNIYSSNDFKKVLAEAKKSLKNNSKPTNISEEFIDFSAQKPTDFVLTISGVKVSDHERIKLFQLVNNMRGTHPTPRNNSVRKGMNVRIWLRFKEFAKQELRSGLTEEELKKHVVPVEDIEIHAIELLKKKLNELRRKR